MSHQLLSRLKRPGPALVLQCGNAERRTLPLDKPALTVGRARGCDIELDAPEVSAVHCVLTCQPGQVAVRDCNSRSGTRVNGSRVEETSLQDGDTLQIGPFGFEVRLPGEYLSPPKSTLPVGVSATRMCHVFDSRRRLALRALALRRKLRDVTRCPRAAGPSEGGIDQLADTLRAKVVTYERRLRRLEELERQVAAERDHLAGQPL